MRSGRRWAAGERGDQSEGWGVPVMSNPNGHIKIKVEACSSGEDERADEDRDAPEIDEQQLKRDQMSSTHADDTYDDHEDPNDSLFSGFARQNWRKRAEKDLLQ
jgi:hypothetical protein